MAHVNKVLRSIEMPDGGHCVDVFVRPDGTFGFEEYRRDEEDGRGWFPVGFFADEVFSSEDQALEKAMESVPWLRDALNGS
jgi:hypothetical protein